jgi:hypothetical protein
LAAGGCTLSLDRTKQIAMNPSPTHDEAALKPAVLIFTDGPHTHRYDGGQIGPDSRFAVSRADLADFMLKTSSDGAFIRMKPLVSA